MLIPVCDKFFGFEAWWKTQNITECFYILVKVEFVEYMDLSVGEARFDSLL